MTVLSAFETLCDECGQSALVERGGSGHGWLLGERDLCPTCQGVSVEKMRRQATISDDGRYRYDLTRGWGDGPLVLWIMLNPSTADASIDDHTIRKCVGFTRRWGFGSLAVVNQFALRATDPDELVHADDPRGPRNVDYVNYWLSMCEFAVAAWGSWSPPKRKVQAKHNYLSVPMLARSAGKTLYSLGYTKAGFPPHPRTLAYATELSPYPRGARYPAKDQL